MVERARVVEQAEEQRPDVGAGTVLVPAEAGDDAVGGPLVLDLEHRPLARLVGSIESLRDDAVETGALEPLEPVRGGGAIAGGRRQVDRRLGGAEDHLESRPPLALRDRAQVLVAERQQVPGDEARRRLLGQHLDPRRGRVDAQQERLELERAVARDDDLAVEDAPLGERGPERVGQFREVAVERLQVARLRVDLIAVPEDERPEAVPLRLEQPAVVGRQRVGGLGEHRFERRFEGECHRQTIARRPPSEPAVRSWQGRQRRPRPFASQVPGRRAGEGGIRRELGLALQEDREDRPPFARQGGPAVPRPGSAPHHRGGRPR